MTDPFPVSALGRCHIKTVKVSFVIKKNPAHGRQSFSQPMPIVAPIPKNPAQNPDQFFQLHFPEDFENLKSLDIGFWEVGAKRPLNGVRNTEEEKILLSKAKFVSKQKKILVRRL